MSPDVRLLVESLVAGDSGTAARQHSRGARDALKDFRCADEDELQAALAAIDQHTTRR